MAVFGAQAFFLFIAGDGTTTSVSLDLRSLPVTAQSLQPFFPIESALGQPTGVAKVTFVIPGVGTVPVTSASISGHFLNIVFPSAPGNIATSGATQVNGIFLY